MPMPVSNRIVERVRAGVLAQRHMGAGVADDIPVHAHVQGVYACSSPLGWGYACPSLHVNACLISLMVAFCRTMPWALTLNLIITLTLTLNP